jgi:hypothetical protein
VKHVVITLGLALLLGAPAAALVQARPDFSGTWKLNQGKSTPGTAGNSPNIPFPSQLVVRQSPTELYVASTSVRQAPLTATFKLDGSKVTLEAPRGITERGEARFDGATLVITTRRSFSSPAGETVIDFKEVWSLNGNVLTVEKTRIEGGESTSEKGVFDKV